MKNNWFEGQSHRLLVGILLVLAYFFLMFGNNIVSLTHPDEVFYIESAKEMLQNNSWLTPMIFDEVQFEKPFLSFAMFASAIKVFGLTPFAGRFWPSLFGIFGVGIVYWISWILFKRKQLSFFAGLILSTSFIHLALSRAVLTDMIFTGFVALSIGFFAMGYYDRSKKNCGLLLWLAFMGIAVITKGLLGICFAAFVVLAFLLYKKELSFLKCPAFGWGIVLFTVIAVPWHILMYMNHGNWFLEEYFYNVHWRRILEAEHGRLDNWYFYIMLLFVGVLPWFLFWINASRSIYLQFKKKLSNRDQIFFLLAWIAGVYAFTQPAHSKLASYIFPAFPAVAILLAYGINEAFEKIRAGEHPRLFRVCAYIMPVFLIAVCIGGVIAARQNSEIIFDMKPIFIAVSMLLTVAALIIIFMQTKRYTLAVLTHAGVTLTFLVSVFFAIPMIEPWVSCKHITNTFQEMETGDYPVLSSKFYVRGVRFYTDRNMAVIDNRGKGFWSPHPIPHLNSDELVLNFFKSNPIVWAVVKEGDIRELKRVAREFSQFITMEITEYSGIGGKFILKIESSS